MQSVQFNIVTRAKYRSVAIQPELDAPNNKSDITAKKKIFVEKVFVLEEEEKVSRDPQIMYPWHLQSKKQAYLLESDETKFRKKQNPTIKEKMILTTRWLKQEELTNKMEEKREVMKRAMAQRVLDADNETKNAKQLSSEEEIAANRKKEEEEKQNDDEDEEDEGNGDDDDPAMIAHRKLMKMNLLILKEKKLLATRATKSAHLEITDTAMKLKALRLILGFGGEGNSKLTPMMPWLLVGRAEIAKDLSFLISNGITHILNVSNDIENSFPPSFVYMRIPVDDDATADLTPHFFEAIKFIKRVQDIKGKILIHCNAGASRSPAIALAYIIMKKPIPLVDAYSYMVAKRPVISINQIFLFQLAKLEITLGEGSSVLYHKDWNFFEFNTIKNVGNIEFRESIGMFTCVHELYKKYRSDTDLLT